MSISRDSGYLLGANLTLLLSSVATGVLTARMMGPTGKGQFYLILQLATTISLFATLGLGPSYQYHLTKGLLTRPAVISHLFGFAGILFAALTALYLFDDRFLKWLSHGALPRPLLGMVCVTAFVCAAILLAGSVLAATPNGIRTNSILGVVSSALYVVFLCIFIWLLRWGVIGAVYSYLLSTGLRLIATFSLITRSTWHSMRLRWWVPGRSLFAFGGSLFIMNLAVTSLFRVDVFIVNGLLGTTALGVYSVAVSFAEMALTGPNALGTSLFRHLPAATPDERLVVLGQASRIILAIGMVIGAGIVVFSHPMVVLMMGTRFRAAVGALILLVPGLVAMSVSYVYSNFYAASGRPLISTIAFGGGLAVNVAMNFLIIPLLGINGAAIASTVAYACASAIFICFLRRHYGLSIRGLVVLRREDLRLLRSKVPFLFKGTVPSEAPAAIT